MAHQIFKALIARPVFFILLLALGLNLWGINYGLPQFLVNDERAGVYGALKMLELKTLVPAWRSGEFQEVLYYLPLPSYLYLALLAPVLGVGYLVSGAADLETYRVILTLDPTIIFVAARALIAVLGVASVYLTYRLGRAIFRSERVGLLAAVLLALSFYHVQLSHVTRHWMPALVLVELAWLTAVRIFESGRVRSYVLAGTFAGLGVGANTAAAVGMIPAILAHFLRATGERLGARLRQPPLYAMLASFFLVSIFLISLYPYGLTQGEVQAGNAAFLSSKLAALSNKDFGGWLGFMWLYLKLLFTYETALIVAALGGGIFAFFSRGRWLLISLVFAIGYLTLLYLFFNVIERGVLFILPVLAAFAGFFLDRLLLRFQSLMPPSLASLYFLFSLLFFLFLAWPLATVLRYDYLLTRPDTRLEAATWIYKNVPAEAKILADLPYLRLTNTPAGIQKLAALDPTGLRIQDRTLLALPQGRYPASAREVLNLHFVSTSSPYRRATDPEFFKAQGYRFFAVEYQYSDFRDLEPQSEALAKAGKLVARFTNLHPAAEAPERALDLSGEISTVPPWRFGRLERFGLSLDVYEL